MRIFIGLLVGMLIFTHISCVSNKKYEELRKVSNQNRVASDSLLSILEDKRHLEYDLQRASANAQQTNEELATAQERFSNLDRNYQDLLRRYDEIIFQNQSLLSNSSQEKQNLTEELGQKQRELDQKARELRRLEDNLTALQASLADQQQQLDNPPPPPPVEDNSQLYEQQLTALQAELAKRDQTLQTLRTKINQALLGFSNTDLSVSEANGKIYVSLSQNLLFASNSSKIDWKGKTAIKKLAEVLQRNPDIQVTVEGHTDSDGSANRNWDLSVDRATSVVKVLTGYGVDPNRITAAGRGLHHPIASNGSAAGKAQNRRTEIILEPRLDELYKIINK
ncbi:MAG: OmpA family protein [Bacteroidota bacterium]